MPVMAMFFLFLATAGSIMQIQESDGALVETEKRANENKVLL